MHTHRDRDKDSAGSEVEPPLEALRLPADRGNADPNRTWSPWLWPSTALLPTMMKKQKKKKKNRKKKLLALDRHLTIVTLDKIGIP